MDGTSPPITTSINTPPQTVALYIRTPSNGIHSYPKDLLRKHSKFVDGQLLSGDDMDIPSVLIKIPWKYELPAPLSLLEWRLYSQARGNGESSEWLRGDLPEIERLFALWQLGGQGVLDIPKLKEDVFWVLANNQIAISDTLVKYVWKHTDWADLTVRRLFIRAYSNKLENSSRRDLKTNMGFLTGPGADNSEITAAIVHFLVAKVKMVKEWIDKSKSREDSDNSIAARDLEKCLWLQFDGLIALVLFQIR
ncbi:hypothetical protein AAE478_000502 [Parahypoxylon ruwenzoriense]